MSAIDREGCEVLVSHSTQVRRYVLEMMTRSKSSHIGSCYSIVDILVTLYFHSLRYDIQAPEWQGRDRFILSKGHGSAALYATLAVRGALAISDLDRYYCDDGLLPGHMDRNALPYVESSAGSLGHGLSIGLGMALANERQGNPGHVFVLLGDGECNEGSVWEAVMLAAQLRLKNLTAIIDYNKLQSFGRTNEVINQEPMAERWNAFGWETFEVDGHNHMQLANAIAEVSALPKVIIAHTVKGKGVSFMEDSLEWHYKSPNPEQFTLACIELEARQ